MTLLYSESINTASVNLLKKEGFTADIRYVSKAISRPRCLEDCLL